MLKNHDAIFVAIRPVGDLYSKIPDITDVKSF